MLVSPESPLPHLEELQPIVLGLGEGFGPMRCLPEPPFFFVGLRAGFFVLFLDFLRLRLCCKRLGRLLPLRQLRRRATQPRKRVRLRRPGARHVGVGAMSPSAASSQTRPLQQTPWRAAQPEPSGWQRANSAASDRRSQVPVMWGLGNFTRASEAEGRQNASLRDSPRDQDTRAPRHWTARGRAHGTVCVPNPPGTPANARMRTSRGDGPHPALNDLCTSARSGQRSARPDLPAPVSSGTDRQVGQRATRARARDVTSRERSASSTSSTLNTSQHGRARHAPHLGRKHSDYRSCCLVRSLHRRNAAAGLVLGRVNTFDGARVHIQNAETAERGRRKR